MNTEHPDHLHISREKLLAFVSSFVGASKGREDDEHPLHPGPWDPVIRAAVERLAVFGPRPEPWRREVFFGPHPEPWKVALASILAKHPEIYDAIGGGHHRGDEVSLNPQPLPPRYALLIAIARVVVGRAELLQDVADATSREGEQRGIIIVGGYLSRFTDEFCGNGFRLKWPFPGPHPHWFTHELDGIDLLVLATQFHQAAKETFSPDLRKHLADAGAKFAEVGVSRLQ